MVVVHRRVKSVLPVGKARDSDAAFLEEQVESMTGWFGAKAMISSEVEGFHEWRMLFAAPSSPYSGEKQDSQFNILGNAFTMLRRLTGSEVFLISWTEKEGTVLGVWNSYILLPCFAVPTLTSLYRG